MQCHDKSLARRLEQAKRIWLFLDYDGTLAEFAPTPDDIRPDRALIDLLSGLARKPGIRVAVVSGRRLGHIRALLPVPEVLLAGTYGLELRDFKGEERQRLEFQAHRPALEALLPQLEGLIAEREDFYLEDKGWSLALHAKYAPDDKAEKVLEAARKILRTGQGLENFRLLGGHKFLEVCPMAGDKGKTVAFLLEEYPWPDATLVYVGDDDKDEEAFRTIIQHAGIAIRVGEPGKPTLAQCWLQSPAAVRRWLQSFL